MRLNQFKIAIIALIISFNTTGQTEKQPLQGKPSKGIDSASVVKERTLFWAQWSNACFPSMDWDSTLFETDGLNYVTFALYNPMRDAEMKAMYCSGMDAEKYLPGMINAGSTAPSKLLVQKGEKLFKIVPKGNNIQGPSPYYLTATDLHWIMQNPRVMEQKLGLPLSSNTAIYDVYAITSLIDNNLVFQSVIAPTDQCAINNTCYVYRSPGGETQTLVINNTDETRWTKDVTPSFSILPNGTPIILEVK